MRTASLMLLACVAACGGDSPSDPRADAGVLDAGPPGSDAAAVDASPADAGQTDAAPTPGPVCDPRAPACATGEKCVTTRWVLEEPWPAPRCVVDYAGQGKREGEPCFAVPGLADGCGSGLACTNHGTGEGFCRRTCARGETCGEADVCVAVDAASGFSLCMKRCTDDASCGSPHWLVCVEREGVRYCESPRATTLTR